MIHFLLPSFLIFALLIIIVDTIRNSHTTDSLFHTDSIFFMSILTGFLSLVTGLLHQKLIPASSDTLFPHPAYVTRGWPIAWLGEYGFGVLLIPLSILINILFVAIFTAASLIAVRYVQKSFLSLSNKFKGRLDLWLVFIFVAFPLWGRLIPGIQFIANYLSSFFNHV